MKEDQELCQPKMSLSCPSRSSSWSCGLWGTQRGYFGGR